MKTKEELIELIQHVNVVIKDESNDYTEQEKIDLIKEYLVDNPETNIGISSNQFSSGNLFLSDDNDLNYPLIVALDTGQLEIAEYLLDLKNVISDDMINIMRLGMNFNPLYHLLNGDFELNKVKKIFDKILNLYKAHPNYYENDSNLKLPISNSFDRQISETDTKEGFAKIAEVINVLLHDNKDVLAEEFLHAGKSVNHKLAKILLEIDSTVINAKNQDGQNALDLYIQSSESILDQASQNNFALYYFLREKGLDHGAASGNFTEKFYNHISFDFDKNPLEIINTIIKLQRSYQNLFKSEDTNDVYGSILASNEKKKISIDLAKKIFGSNGDVERVSITAEEEHDLWMVLKENQPSTYKYGSSNVSMVGKLNKPLPTKLAKKQFDQFDSLKNKPLPTKLAKEQFDQSGSLKNLALLKMVPNGLPSKELYVAVKNDWLPQDLVELVINYMRHQTLDVNEYGWQLAQESETLSMSKEDINVLAIGEQASTESVH